MDELERGATRLMLFSLIGEMTDKFEFMKKFDDIDFTPNSDKSILQMSFFKVTRDEDGDISDYKLLQYYDLEIDESKEDNRYETWKLFDGGILNMSFNTKKINLPKADKFEIFEDVMREYAGLDNGEE